MSVQWDFQCTLNGVRGANNMKYWGSIPPISLFPSAAESMILGTPLPDARLATK